MSMVVKRIQIEFASPKINAVEAIYDLRKAVEKAGLNLFSRYNIRLQSPMIVDGKVIIEVQVPEDQANDFSCGNRLRGISAYLIKYCGGRYNSYQVGNRLLTYTEVSEQKLPSNETATADMFEAIADLAQLMERTDKESKDKVNRIIDILNEGR